MNKPKASAVFAALFIPLLLSACFTGLTPAWKTGETRLAVSLPSVADLPAAENRALVQGIGFLYLRTLGGPAGAVGPLYGPFPIDKTSFETKLIPPGRFESILVLYSSKLLDEVPVGNDGLTFRQVFSLPDAELDPYFEHAEGVESEIDIAISGYASGAMSGPFTVAEGVRNQLPLLTLTPIGSPSIPASETGISFTVSSEGLLLERRFYRLEGIDSAAGFSALECSLTASSAGTVGRIGLYEADGTPVGLSAPQGTTAAGGVKTVSVPFTGHSDYYLYLEYSGTFAVSCKGVYAPITGDVTVSITGGNTALKNQRAFFGIYDAADLVDYMGPPETAVGLGIISLDASGNGTAQAVAPGTSNPPTLLAGHDYVVYLFVDMKPNYGGVTLAALTSLGDASGITPHYGDYVTSSDNTFSAGTNPTIDGRTLETYSTHVYFVSQTGGGTGALATSPVTLAAALNDAQTRLAQGGTGVEIYLSGSLTLTSSFEAAFPLSLMSAGDTPFTIDIGAITGGPAIVVPPKYDASDQYLFMRKVIIDGKGVGRSGSAVLVDEEASFVLGPGAVIQNAKNTIGDGGAVAVTGGNFSLMGGTITKCSAKNGGGVYVTGGTTENRGTVMVSDASAVTDNTASTNGGGINVGPQGIVILSSMNPLLAGASVSGNTAYDGGGIYIDAAGIFSDGASLAASWVTGNFITGTNTAGTEVANYGTTLSEALYVTLTPGGIPDPDLPYTYSLASGDPVNFSVDETVYENCLWYIDGASSPWQGASSPVLNAASALELFGTTGQHSVSVIAQGIVDGEYYSAFIAVQVN